MRFTLIRFGLWFAVLVSGDNVIIHLKHPKYLTPIRRTSYVLHWIGLDWNGLVEWFYKRFFHIEWAGSSKLSRSAWLTSHHSNRIFPVSEWKNIHIAKLAETNWREKLFCNDSFNISLCALKTSYCSMDIFHFVFDLNGKRTWLKKNGFRISKINSYKQDGTNLNLFRSHYN